MIVGRRMKWSFDDPAVLIKSHTIRKKTGRDNPREEFIELKLNFATYVPEFFPMLFISKDR